MAYVAMNRRAKIIAKDQIFLNGVCRHEHVQIDIYAKDKFLNGVCRHELKALKKCTIEKFLNGVCRHEQ